MTEDQRQQMLVDSNGRRDFVGDYRQAVYFATGPITGGSNDIDGCPLVPVRYRRWRRTKVDEAQHAPHCCRVILTALTSR